MSRRANIAQQDGRDLNQLRDSLLKFRADLQKSAPETMWEDMEPVEILNQLNLPNIAPAMKENLQYWPTPIRKYFTKEVIESLKVWDDYKQDELETISKYLETALVDPANCTDEKDREEKLDKAMKAVSHQLHRYYGREEGDEEFPCWPPRR